MTDAHTASLPVGSLLRVIRGRGWPPTAMGPTIGMIVTLDHVEIETEHSMVYWVRFAPRSPWQKGLYGLYADEFELLEGCNDT